MQNQNIVHQQSTGFEIAPGRWIGEGYPCFIVAEIGQNHQGNRYTARDLVRIAKECGADCVKFQKSNIQSRFTQERLSQPYSGSNSFGRNYKEHREHLELSELTFKELNDYAASLGIFFTASGMDKPSIDFLNSLSVPFFKIGSADTTNLPLLKHACKYKKPLVISTGMTNLKKVIKMYNEVSQLNSQLVLMQCTSSYPTSDGDVNLNVIKTYKDLFPKAVIGYSGHELGTCISLAAVAVGAKILERHLTIGHKSKGSDHSSSLEPSQFTQLVQDIRRIESAMGSSKKLVQNSEIPCYEKLGKTIVANRFLVRGTIIEENMLDVKVAVKQGFDPLNFYDLIGKTLNRDYAREETIMPEDILEATVNIERLKCISSKSIYSKLGNFSLSNWDETHFYLKS